MEKLSLVLWRERELLDLLLYRLEQQQLVLAGGRTRWLARVADEVDAAQQALRETEVLRAVTADRAATSVGLPAGSSLRDLAHAAPEPFRSMLLDHRDACAAAAHEVAAMADVNRGLLTEGRRSARKAVMVLASSAGDGRHDSRRARAVGLRTV